MNRKEEMSDTEKLQLIERALKKLNGVNVIVEDENGKILVGRSTYGEQLFMLPGGGIERGELPKHAAVSETEEETGIIIEEDCLELISCFIQRLKGVQSASGNLFLYRCRSYTHSELVAFVPELTDIKFMSFDEIVSRKNEFGLAYFRMILMFMRIKDGFEKTPKEARLSDIVEYFYKGERIAV